MVARHGGEFPAELAAARALPGVGEYTAGAVLSIAYRVRVPCVDGNVERVLCRALGVGDDPRRNPGRQRVRAAATALVDCGTPGDVNQALMELGATVCRPVGPGCEGCPLEAACEAHATGREDELPALAARPATERVLTACAVARRGDRVLVARRGEGGVWGGLWELPQVEVGPEGAEAVLREHLRTSLGLEAEVGEALGQVRHSVMNRTTTLVLYQASVRQGRLRPVGYVAARWAREGELGALPMSAPHRRVVAMVSAGERPEQSETPRGGIGALRHR
jgi:A/G-specific adenine glycosylase